MKWIKLNETTEVLEHAVERFEKTKNKALTFGYWGSKEYHLHRRINDRVQMLKRYDSQRASLNVGVIINSMLFKIHPGIENQLMWKVKFMSHGRN